MPPSCASAIARRASVTVSIAAETSGRLRRMLREREVARSVSRGRTSRTPGPATRRRRSALCPEGAWESSGRKSELYGCRCKVPVCAPSVTPRDRRAPLHCAANSSRGARGPWLDRSSPCSPLSRRACIALPAEAQWKWRDKGGHVQYSDLPPPAGTPDQDILAAAERAPRARRHRRRAASAAASARRRRALPRRRSRRRPPTPSSRPSARRPRAEAAAKNKAEQDKSRRRQGRQLQPRAGADAHARERHPPGAAPTPRPASASTSTTSSAPTRLRRTQRRDRRRLRK